MRGRLIAFEGLDQSGKQTQAESLRDHIAGPGRACRLLSFPDYETAIGTELSRALHGERDYTADVMQLLYVTNRYDAGSRSRGCSNAEQSCCAIGMSHHRSRTGGAGPGPRMAGRDSTDAACRDPTILLDIAPEIAVRRKSTGRDRHERDLALLSRVRESYRRQAAAGGWLISTASDRRPPSPLTSSARSGHDSAAVTARTSRAPASSTRAHASSVAPVVPRRRRAPGIVP
jgi:dTMP kinase